MGDESTSWHSTHLAKQCCKPTATLLCCAAPTSIGLNWENSKLTLLSCLLVTVGGCKELNAVSSSIETHPRA